jgi:cardiolipin synthase
VKIPSEIIFIESAALMAGTWKIEQLFHQGDAYFSDIIAGITHAVSTIEFETYIYDDDQIGRGFEKALIQAAQRGVKVRVLVDGIGAGSWANRRALELARNGVEVRIYHIVRLTNLFRRILSDLGVRRRAASLGSQIFARLNRRNHRKMVIIDGVDAWAGSLNISAVHSEKAHGSLAWRDTGIRVGADEGDDGIRALSIGFEYAWRRAHDLEGKRHWIEQITQQHKERRVGSHLVRLNYTLRMRRQGYKDFCRRIDRSRERIWITNAYLAPSKPILRRLERAKKRGVDVRILVPRKSDVFFMPWVAASYYTSLLEDKIRIFEYLPRFLHAKSVIVDRWATVGSSNLNRRSLFRDFEVDIVVSQESSLQQLELTFLDDLGQSQEITSAHTGWRSALGKLILYLFKEYI